MYWSTKQLATALNVTPRRINQLVGDGVLPRQKKDGHEAQQAVSHYLRFIEKRVSAVPLTAAKERKLLADAALAELKLEVERGRYVLVDDVKKVAFDTGRRVRDGILNIPERITAIVAAESDAGKVYSVLMGELRQALEGLASE